MCAQNNQGNLGKGKPLLDIPSHDGRIEIRKLKPPAAPVPAKQMRRPAARPK